MKASWDYYNHRYYNYNYDDMMDISFGSDMSEKIVMTSKVYPTKLEVKLDENTNLPYLYYEGIVHTNKGLQKITFPKLDLSLECIQTQSTTSDTDIRECLGYKFVPKITKYKMSTEFCNIGDDVLYEMKSFDERDYRDFYDYVNKI